MRPQFEDNQRLRGEVNSEHPLERYGSPARQEVEISVAKGEPFVQVHFPVELGSAKVVAEV